MAKAEIELRAHADQYCRSQGLEAALCFVMPAGYESANGMYDPDSKTVFMNQDRLEKAPVYERLFYLYHELRHAVQYQHPSRFDRLLVKSLDYVIGYNGECCKKVHGEWKTCRLCGTEKYFTQMYLAQPYEADANTFAFEMVKEILGDCEALRTLHSFWTPAKTVSAAQYEALYAQIDQLTEA